MRWLCWLESLCESEVLVAQLWLTLCDPMDLCPARLLCPWDFLARILEWVAIPFSKGSSWLRDWTWVSCITGRFFTIWAKKEAHYRPRTSTIQKTGKWWDLCWSCLDPSWPIKGSQGKCFKSYKQTIVNYFFKKAELFLVTSLWNIYSAWLIADWK